MRFLALGEIMVELAPAANELLRMGFAGDTFNCAWYARRLLPSEWQVSYGTVLGQDAVSDDMARFIADQGVDTDALRRVPDRTIGLYLIQTQDGERSFSYWRGQSAAKTLADDPDWLAQTLAGRNLIQFSGITLAILAPPARAAFCAALTQARAAGAHVAFDTNLRPKLWSSADEMREGLIMGASVADTVLPSFDEEQMAFGDKTQEATIARYRDVGATTVAVKDGGGPCHVWDQTEGQISYTPPAVATMRDSTAAGDSFAAGFLCTRAMGGSVQQAVERACWLAGEVIQRPGALADDIFEGERT